MQFAEVTWISIRPPLLTWYLLASLLVYIPIKRTILPHEKAATLYRSGKLVLQYGALLPLSVALEL